MIGVRNVRDDHVSRLADSFSGWRNADVQSKGPTSIPAALQCEPPLYFVGNSAAVLPFVVRTDVGLVTPEVGFAEREYRCWLFGPSFRLMGRPLYQFEAHDGFLHGFDSGTDTIHVHETATVEDSASAGQQPNSARAAESGIPAGSP